MTLDRENKEKIMREFARSPEDTGSTEVQVALLSKEIDQLTEHCQQNPKDFASRRGLLQKVNHRKRLLQYLERTNEDQYKQLIGKLGLRK